jgi:hypothetical protein
MARRSSRSNQGRGEWIGGVRRLDVEVETADGFERPMIAILLDGTSGKVLATDVGTTVSLVDLVPMARTQARGRVPAHIRVESEADAIALRRALPSVDVAVGSVPELDALVAELGRGLPTTIDAPFAADDVGDDVLRRFVAAAWAFHRAAPWKTIGDHQVVELAVPALGVDGACVSVIGGMGENFGLLVFSSLDALDAFGESASSARPTVEEDIVALQLEPADEWPRSFRQRVAALGWPVAGKDVIPMASFFGPEGARPGDRFAFELATAAAEGIVAFVGKHADLFSPRWDGRRRVLEHAGPSGLKTRMAAPPSALDELVAEERPIAATPSRNAPCPCGSGKKYKRCCIDQEFNSPAAIARGHQEIERRLIPRIHTFLVKHDLLDQYKRGLGSFLFQSGPPEPLDQLIRPYALYASLSDGAPSFARRFLLAEGKKLTESERAYLEAQLDARLSLFEVVGVDRGTSLRLRDRLTGRELTAYDRSASQSIPLREILLARVVELDGICTLSALHGRTLPPNEAAHLEATIPDFLAQIGAKKLDDVLGQPSFERFLIEAWLGLLDASDRRPPPTLQTTDGEPLLFTTDHFAFAANDRALLVERLSALSDIVPGEDDDSFAFLKQGNARHPHLDNTVLGHVKVGADSLTLDTNSVARADRLRARLLALGVPSLRHRIREHSDPLSSRAERESTSGAMPVEELLPEALDAIKQLTEEHYRTWPDVPLPALGGKTPREAARSRSKKSRAAVDLLLRTMENADERHPNPFYRYDFSRLRRELGLPD